RRTVAGHGEEQSMSEFAQPREHIETQQYEAGPAGAAPLLREEAAVLRSFYESAPMMMGVVELLDDDILHLSDNAAGARFMGVPPGSTGGRLASELGVPPKHIQAWLGHYRAAMQSRQP